MHRCWVEQPQFLFLYNNNKSIKAYCILFFYGKAAVKIFVNNLQQTIVKSHLSALLKIHLNGHVCDRQVKDWVKEMAVYTPYK